MSSGVGGGGVRSAVVGDCRCEAGRQGALGRHTARNRWYARVPLVLDRTLLPSLTRITLVHGWINGHPHTPELDADFGDFASLLEHLYAQAASAGVELLLFDSGDLIEGTGLSDASDVHGQYIFPIVQMVANYTAITIGNHDLGRANTVDLMRRSFIPFFNPPNAAESTYRYLTSTTWSAAHQQPPEKFLAQPWTIHTTPLGMRLLMLGFIFNFTQAAPNTVRESSSVTRLIESISRS